MKTNPYQIAVLLFSGAILPSILIGQDLFTLSLEAVRDNTIYSEGEKSNGQGNYLFVGKTQGGDARRALLAFDLSEIPSDAAIQEVSLSLYMNKTVADDVSISAHRMLSDWGEGSSKATDQEGSGATAPFPGQETAWRTMSKVGLIILKPILAGYC